MPQASFWYRTIKLIGWALVILGALRSEPLLRWLIGDQYAVTHHWCGAWGCSASFPKLLAWQIPVTLVFVPLAWMMVRSVPFVHRHSGLMGLLIGGAAITWVIAVTMQSFAAGQIHGVTDIGRRMVFASIAGTSVVIPTLLAAGSILLDRRINAGLACHWPTKDWDSEAPAETLAHFIPEGPLRANADGGACTKQPEDFRDIVVSHVDTTS